MPQSVRILSAEPVTHNVRRYRLERPAGFSFEPGQATDVSIDQDDWREKKSPFTFTGLSDADHLEFTIKSYFERDGVTKHLWSLQPGDRLILRDAWGAITYKGPGVFLAGGAGVTPFIAILRDLDRRGALSGNRLIVSNKTERDIILRDEFESMEGLNHDWIISNDRNSKLWHGRLDEEFLKLHVIDFSQRFYLCGPDRMVLDLRDTLERLGARPDAMVFET